MTSDLHEVQLGVGESRAIAVAITPTRDVRIGSDDDIRLFISGGTIATTNTIKTTATFAAGGKSDGECGCAIGRRSSASTRGIILLALLAVVAVARRSQRARL